MFYLFIFVLLSSGLDLHSCPDENILIFDDINLVLVLTTTFSSGWHFSHTDNYEAEVNEWIGVHGSNLVK